jgi:hypothetical protein
MIKLQRIHITLVAVILAFAGCDKLIYDQEEAGGQPPVYLSVTRSAHTDGNESINKDDEDFEDRVHDLAMLVFDSSTGVKVAEYFDESIAVTEKNNTFVVQLTPGQRDFYFVANMPIIALKAITAKAQMETYMNTLRNLDASLYLGAAETNGFPMSRVYLNQTITTGGNIYQPAPFRPDGEDKVKLIRVVAKLEVRLAGTDLDVKDIYFRNANRNFYLVNPSATTPSTYFNDNSTNEPLHKVEDNTYIYYMPEAIIASATWSATGHNKPINYFTIETNSGAKYDIPIISNGTLPITDNYMAKATGNDPGFTPQYTIKRNDHYKYVINNLQKIEILYLVNEWELVNKILYMGYGYNVEIDGTTVTISNTVDACDPHHVRLETVGSITFSDGTTVKDFDDYHTTAAISYELSVEPTVGYGDYLRAYYNDMDTPAKIFSK